MQVSALLHNGPKKIVIPQQTQQIEQRRVIGPMRERTIFIQTNFPKEIENHRDYNSNYNQSVMPHRTYAPIMRSNSLHNEENIDENADWENCVSRISKHVDDVLILHQSSIDEKLHQIENHAEKTREVQESIEKRLRHLKKMLKQKRSPQTAQTPQIRLQCSQPAKSTNRTAQTPDIFSHLRFNFDFN